MSYDSFKYNYNAVLNFFLASQFSASSFHIDSSQSLLYNGEPNPKTVPIKSVRKIIQFTTIQVFNTNSVRLSIKRKNIVKLNRYNDELYIM